MKTFLLSIAMITHTNGMLSITFTPPAHRMLVTCELTDAQTHVSRQTKILTASNTTLNMPSHHPRDLTCYDGSPSRIPLTQ